MPILQIEHEIPDYENWKKAFDNDPINRKNSGVRRFRIYKPVGEEGAVIVELEFDNMENLQATLRALQNLWNKVQGTIIMSPKTRIMELIETKEI